MSDPEKTSPSGPPSRLVSWLFGSDSGSIATKLLRAFLLVSVLGMLVVIIAAEVMFQSILGITEQSNHDIGETAALSSNEALTDTVLADVETLVQAKADLIKESLDRLSGDLATLASYADELYAHPEAYRQVPFEHLRLVPGHAGLTVGAFAGDGGCLTL